MDIDQELEKRINPEKSRNFTISQFEQNLKEISSLAADLLIDNHGTVRVCVAGTNGKGSTARRLAQNAETGCGLYTSPHLISYTERIRYKQKNKPLKEISKQELSSLLPVLRAKNPDIFRRLSYFELLTFLALLYFQKNNLNLQVYEAGLGGRLDATRTVQPQVVILTSVGLDHMKLLGNTRLKIAREKLQIAGPSTELMILPECRLKNQIDPWLKERFPRARIEWVSRSIHDSAPEFISEFYDISFRDHKTVEKEANTAAGSKLVFDSFHNPAALMYSLSSGFYRDKEVLVLFGTATDRNPGRMAFLIRKKLQPKRLLQLTGEGLYPAVGNPYFDETAEVSQADLISRIAVDFINRNGNGVVLIAGSHRLYKLFEHLKWNFSKTYR